LAPLPRWLLSTMSMGMNALCLIALLLAVVSATTVVDLSTIPACQISGCTSQCDVKQYLPSGLSGDVEFMSSKSGTWCVAANNNYDVDSLTLSGQVTFYVNGQLSIQSMTSSPGSTFTVGDEASFFGNANIGGYFGGFAAGQIIFIEGALTTTSTSIVALTEGSGLQLSSSGATFGGSVSGPINFEGTTTIAAGSHVSGVSAVLPVSATLNILANCSFTNFYLESQQSVTTLGVVNIAQDIELTSAGLAYLSTVNPPSLTIYGPGHFVVNNGVAIGAGTLSLASDAYLSFSGALTGTGSVNIASGSTLAGTTSTFAGTISQQSSDLSSSYLGCYNDQSSRDLPYEVSLTSSLTIAGCISSCSSAGYDYAAAQDGNQCFCGNSYGKYGSAGNACSMTCQGDGAQICGGAWLNSVYKA